MMLVSRHSASDLLSPLVLVTLLEDDLPETDTCTLPTSSRGPDFDTVHSSAWMSKPMPATSVLKRQTVSRPRAKLGPMLPSFSVQMITRESNKVGPLASSVGLIVVGLKPGIDKTLLPSLEVQTVRGSSQWCGQINLSVDESNMKVCQSVGWVVHPSWPVDSFPAKNEVFKQETGNCFESQTNAKKSD